MTPDAPRTDDNDLAGAFHEAMTVRGMICTGTHAIGEALCQSLAALVAMDDHLRVVLGDELAEATPADSLDAAWAAVEAALPEGWSIWWVQNDRHIEGGWDATAGWDGTKNPGEARTESASGPNPAGALRSLAAALRTGQRGG